MASFPKAFVDWWKVESPAKANGSSSQEAPVHLKPVLQKLWSLCAPDVALLFMASAFMVVASLCELAIPHYATKSIFAASEGAPYMGFLKVLTAMVAAYGISAALRGFCFSILNNRMTRRLRTELFASLANRETAFFDGEDVGNLTSRLQADCQAMTKVIATNANIAIRNLLQAVGGVIYLYLLSPSLCGMTVAISAVLWAVTIVYGDFARRMQKIFQDVLAESNTVAEEALTLSRVVRTFGTEGTETKRYTTWLDKLYEVGKRQAAGYSLFVASGHIACYASKVAALVVGCGMVLTGKLTAEQLTNFIMYVEFVTYASLNVCDEFTEICEAVGASERVVAMLGAAPAPQIAPGIIPASFSGRVSLEDVKFSYPSRPGNMALNGVSLTFEPGKLTALVGLSGSGKTTVCALLQRLYDPTHGRLVLDADLDVRAADAAWYRQQIGVVPQEPRLFSRSIAANIAYGMEHAPPSPADIEEAARAANAHDFIMSLPQGYETQVTDKLLSGGQKQRLALARALIRKPKVLVLDEFSSALDAESEAQVHAALDRAMSARDRTVVVIAHRLSTVRHADCIVVMDKGKIHEMGSHHELLSRRGIYWQLVCRQQYGIDPNAAGATDTDSESILAAAAELRAAAAEAAAAAANVAMGLPPSSSSAGASATSSRDSGDSNTSSGHNGSGAGLHRPGAAAAARASPASTSSSASLSAAAAAPATPYAAAATITHGSNSSMEEEPVSGHGGVLLGAVSDDCSKGAGNGNASSGMRQASGEASLSQPGDSGGSNGGGNGSGYSNGNGNGNGSSSNAASDASMLRALGMSSSSMTTSLATLDDDIGDVDEAGRPQVAGSGRMSAVLAGVVVLAGAPPGGDSSSSNSSSDSSSAGSSASKRFSSSNGANGNGNGNGVAGHGSGAAAASQAGQQAAE
ncbi:hypothetical protein HYH02_011122 [Chlamydomonas schloesseri]|uniref:Uncharacterized protein n=1 Tax=Chlamydomonas schloesseri TaxID=2026947 RepID=A0A835T5G0_9CHLO|nr:hypothetical protein HYH02_011122 [Chlamydomonas schloesseri]|eukprot:KAG2437746.1 hypothetical protein HYH02_011122 [Chlamydomonas schloesseri]